MILIDHEKTRGCPYCPMMREECNSGSTKSMKGKKCAAWRAMPMLDKDKNMSREVSACSVYEWPTALGYEISGFLQQSRASVDKVATEVRNHHATFVGALSEESRARLLNADPRMQVENKNGSI